MNYSVLDLYNPGVLQGRLPDDLFNEIKNRCLDSNYLKETYNHSLVAFIEKEMRYPKNDHPEFCDFLLETYRIWRKTFNIGLEHIDIKNGQMPVVEDIWVNYQRKNEWNPNHFHGGSVSFVIWIQIPYEIENELNVDYYTKTNDPLRKAAFEFTYPTYTEGVKFKTIWVNKQDEGRILMFPSKMVHCVYPFTTSDEVRISVAGNMNVIKLI